MPVVVRVFLYGCAGAAVVGAASLTALLYDGTDLSQGTALTSRVEAIVAALMLGFGIPAFFLLRDSVRAHQRRLSWRSRVCVVFLPALPVVIHLWLFSMAAYEALFLGDQDFTNISSALNNTARGIGLLETPFLGTGANASYLGHHFSPGLLSAVPFYWLYHQGLLPESTTHLLYAHVLLLFAVGGFLSWAIFIEAELEDPLDGIFAMTLLVSGFLVWRLLFSFHYELPVLLFSGLAFAGYARRNWPLFAFALLAWVSWKEDLGLYVALFGVFLTLRREAKVPLYVGPAVSVLAVFYFIFARLSMSGFAGGDPPEWELVWSDVWTYEPNRFALVAALASVAFLPLIQVRLGLVVIAPLFALHLFAKQPWFAEMQSYYGYTVLPFLMLSVVLGFRRIRGWLEWLAPRGRAPAYCAMLAIAMAAASWDRSSPLPRPHPDPRFELITDLFADLPRGSCIQTQIPFTAHARLDQRAFPLMVPENSPYRDRLPGPHNFAEFHFTSNFCPRYYLVLDAADPRPPVYTAEHLAKFEEFAEKNLTETFREKSIVVYRLEYRSGL